MATRLSRRDFRRHFSEYSQGLSEELYNALPLTECGYTDATVKHASPDDMKDNV